MSKATAKSSKAPRRSARLQEKGRKTYCESSDESSDEEEPTITVKDAWNKYMNKEQLFFVEGYYQYLIMLVLLKPLIKDNDGNVIEAELCIVFKAGYTARTLYKRFNEILNKNNGIFIIPINIFEIDNSNLSTDEKKNHFKSKEFKLNIGQKNKDKSYSFPIEYFAVNHTVVKIFNQEFENLGYNKYYTNPNYNENCDFFDILNEYYKLLILDEYDLDNFNLLLLNTTNNLSPEEKKQVKACGFPFVKKHIPIKEIENDYYDEEEYKSDEDYEENRKPKNKVNTKQQNLRGKRNNNKK